MSFRAGTWRGAVSRAFRRRLWRPPADHDLALGEELVPGARDRDDALVLLLQLLPRAGGGRVEERVERADHRVHAGRRAAHAPAEPSQHPAPPRGVLLVQRT